MLALLCLTTMSAWAYDFEVDGIYYTKSGTNATVTYRDNSYNSYSGNVIIPDTVTHDGVAYPVTAIGENAFSGCTGLTAVTIPSGVTSIGSSAFKNCSSLDGIVIPEGVTKINSATFSGCSSLTAINIPAGMTSIHTYMENTVNEAFYGCNALKSLVWNAINCSTRGSMPTANIEQVTIGEGVITLPSKFLYGSKVTEVNIPSSVKNIYEYAFENCTKLEGITIPAGVTNLSYSQFSGCTGLKWLEWNAVNCSSMGNMPMSNIERVTIGDGVTKVPDGFVSGSKITEVTIPASVTSIGGYAFRNCTKLESVNIPVGVTSIGSVAFNGCSALKYLVWDARNCSTHGDMPTANIEQVTIGDEVTILPSYFLDGSKITEVTIPASVTSIGAYAFRNCAQLTGAIIPNGVTAINNYLFYGCSNLETVTLPTSATTFGEYAFYNCKKLKSVVIPNGVPKINKSTFSSCSSLEYAVLPSSVTSIGEYAFNGCTGLKSVNIPAGVTSIGSQAFYNCSSLQGVTIPAGITNLGNSQFYNCNGVKWLEWNARNCSSLGGISSANIEQVTIGDGVTILPSYFMDGSKITEVTIPASVTSIGAYAFRNCTGLTEVVIPNGVTAINSYLFYGCTNLESVTLPTNATALGEYVFYNCSKLDGIVIPEGVPAINRGAFSNCSSLTAITIPATVTSIYGTGYSDAAFYGCNAIKSLVWNARNCSTIGNMPTANIETVSIGNEVKQLPNYFITNSKVTEVDIPASVTSIGEAAFKGCIGLDEIIIPEGTTSIGEAAFKGCTGLIEVVLPSGLTTISMSLFSDCINLTTVNIPSGVTSIRGGAFMNCSSLDGIVIPEGVTKIETYTFQNCSSLTAINIPAGVTSIATEASYLLNPFYGCNALKHLEWNARYCGNRGSMPTANIETVIIGNEVRHLPGKFLDGSKVTEVIIPPSVTSIGDEAFQNCKGLTEIVLPDGLTSIDMRLFAGCTNLTSVNIPANVTNISYEAFNACTGLTQILCKPVTPPSVVNDYVFQTCYNRAKLIVPRGSIATYKAANFWKKFSTIVGDEYDFEVDGIYYMKTGENTASVTYRDNDYNSYSGTVAVPKQVDYEGVTYRVTGIGFEAFKDCPDLTRVSMSKRITSIDYNAFENCTGLTKVTIPDNVTAIGASAFKGCTTLTDATIGSSVATIGAQAFDGCDALTTVMSRSVTPPTLAGMNCFNCYETATLKVPIAAVEDYSSADYWKEFMQIVGVEINAGLGDVDGDGHIGIADVTSLVDYLLNGGDASFYVDNADIDEDGNIGIADVADLIDYLLSGDDD